MTRKRVVRSVVAAGIVLASIVLGTIGPFTVNRAWTSYGNIPAAAVDHRVWLRVGIGVVGMICGLAIWKGGWRFGPPRSV